MPHLDLDHIKKIAEVQIKIVEIKIAEVQLLIV